MTQVTGVLLVRPGSADYRWRLKGSKEVSKKEAGSKAGGSKGRGTVVSGGVKSDRVRRKEG